MNKVPEIICIKEISYKMKFKFKSILACIRSFSYNILYLKWWWRQLCCNSLLVNVDVDLMWGGCTGCNTQYIYKMFLYKCVCAPALLICRKRSPRDPLLENRSWAVVTMLWQSCVLHVKLSLSMRFK